MEHNDVGIHEYMELMKLIHTEPFIAVNTGLGTFKEVVEEVEYCNGATNTPIGKLRSLNGHPEPYKEIDELQGKDIQIAMDEWNYWYGDYIYGELGVRYHHKDALGVAIGLHESFRNSDIYFMTNYAQTVNVIGCIKTTPTAACFATTGLPLKLYREHFGTIPLEIKGEKGNLDIAAALTADKSAITVAVVNPTGNPEQVAVDIGKTKIKSKGKKWMIHHSDPEIFNEPEKTPNVTIQEEDVELKEHKLNIPSYSIVLYRLKIK